MYQSDFSPDEFRARRGRMCEAIDTEAWVLLQGAPQALGVDTFRQYNEFYYFCGVEVPHAYLLVNASDGKTLLFLPHESQVGRQAEGDIVCAENADAVCEAAGVDRVLPV